MNEIHVANTYTGTMATARWRLFNHPDNGSYIPTMACTPMDEGPFGRMFKTTPSREFLRHRTESVGP